MAETKELKVVITSDSKQAQEHLTGFGGALQRVGEIAAGIGLERLAEKFLDFGKTLVVDSVKAFQESENKLTQLDAVLKSTAGVAGMTKDSIVSLSKALQDQTTFSDEAVLETENLLLTFTNIGKETFPEATKAVLDMSIALGQDTKSGAIQLGKALQDPILGITALRRVGVNFTDEQKETIKTLVQSGKTLEAQKLILKELNTEFGGSAAAAATTYQGKMKQLMNTVDDMQEVFGKAIVNAIYPFIAALTPYIKTLGQVLEGNKTWGVLLSDITAKFPLIGGAINAIIVVFNNFRKVVDVVLNFINDLWKAHKDEILKVAKELYPQIVELWNSIKLYVGDAMELIKLVVNIALGIIKVAWDVFGAGLIQSLKGVFEIILNTYKLFFDTIHNLFTFFKDLFTGNWKALWTDVKNIFVGIFEDIKGVFKGFQDFAMGIINGIINGVKSAVNAITGASGGTSKKALGGYGSGLTLVGEEGPELVSLPSGSYVHTAQQTAGMMGGATVNIYNPSVRNDNDIKEIVAQVKRALGRENELARWGVI